MEIVAVVVFFAVCGIISIAIAELLDSQPLGVLVGIGGPILILLGFSLVEWARGNIDMWGNPVRKKRALPIPEPPPRPPTDRQLNFIDALIEERDVPADDWALERDPETIDEASASITYLLSLPYRPDRDD